MRLTRRGERFAYTTLAVFIVAVIGFCGWIEGL